MCFLQIFICMVLLLQVVLASNLDGGLAVDRNTTISNETVTIYNIGVFMGIVDPEKYSLESFEQHQFTLKKLYEKFVLRRRSGLINYLEWLIMNDYGVLADTKESIFDKKTIERTIRDKKRFLRLLITGDILVSSRSDSGLIGHAAIMVSDEWVLEMKGGKKWKNGIEDNNRQISKEEWYDRNCDESVVVYRLPDNKKAHQAALWVDRNYYNPYGGQDKEIKVKYKITPDFTSKNPSYSSKLVLHAFYYGTKGVLMRGMSKQGVINPNSIPKYFRPQYKLNRMGKFYVM